MKRLLSIILLLTVSNIANEIIIGDTYYGAGIYMRDYTIKGNGEECKLTYNQGDNGLIYTTCLSITNSKGIDIFCTKKKKICKTKAELLDFITYSGKKEDVDNSDVLGRWVHAHNTQNMNELKQLYANEITYYGKKLPKSQCIKDKKRALAKYPQFQVRIDHIKYIPVTPTLTKITFDKYVKFNSNKKEKMYPSYLLIDTGDSSIIVESDSITDKNFKKSSVHTPIKAIKVKKNKQNTYQSKKSGILGRIDNCEHGNGKECLMVALFYAGTDEIRTIHYIRKACRAHNEEACRILDHYGYSH